VCLDPFGSGLRPGELPAFFPLKPLIRADLLDADEFTRFYFLMKNLAPYMLLLIIDPSKANNHRADRNPGIGRRNLELVLYGSASARPLFEWESLQERSIPYTVAI